MVLQVFSRKLLGPLTSKGTEVHTEWGGARKGDDKDSKFLKDQEKAGIMAGTHQKPKVTRPQQGADTVTIRIPLLDPKSSLSMVLLAPSKATARLHGRVHNKGTPDTDSQAHSRHATVGQHSNGTATPIHWPSSRISGHRVQNQWT